MRKISKIISITTALILLCCFTISAAIPSGTAVFQEKAYSLEYVNEEANVDEILNQLIKSEGKVYVKAYDGKWYDNLTGEEIDKDILPEVVYKTSDGKIQDYAKADGEQIILDVVRINFVSNNKLNIVFNKEIDKESALDKQNYKIDGQSLEAEDKIEVVDSRTVVISLEQDVENKAIKNIEVSKEIKDINSNSMENEVVAKIMLLSKDSERFYKEEVIDCDVNILGNRDIIKNLTIKGNVYIGGEKVFLMDSVVEENIYVDPGKDGTTYITDVTAKEIAILSGGSHSINIRDVEAEELNVISNSLVRVAATGKTKINKTFVRAYSIIDSKSADFGNIIISIDEAQKQGEDKFIEFRGEFKNPIIVESSVKIKAAKGAKIEKLEIAVKDEDAKVELEGDFKEVEVNDSTNLVLENGTIDTLTANADVDLETGEDGVVASIETNGNEIIENGEEVKEDRKDNNEGKKTQTPYYGGITTGNTTPTEVDKIASRFVKAINKMKLSTDGDEYNNYVTYGDYDSNNHKFTITIVDAKKETTIEELLNKTWKLGVENPDAELLTQLKDDSKKIKVKLDDEEETSLKVYIKNQLANAGYTEIADQLPNTTSSSTDIINFLNGVYGDNNTIDIVKAMRPHDQEIKVNISGEELKTIKITNEKGIRKIYDVKDNRYIYAQEIRDLFNGESLRQVKLNELKGTYEFGIGEKTYSIIIK